MGLWRTCWELRGLGCVPTFSVNMVWKSSGGSEVDGLVLFSDESTGIDGSFVGASWKRVDIEFS